MGAAAAVPTRSTASAATMTHGSTLQSYEPGCGNDEMTDPTGRRTAVVGTTPVPSANTLAGWPVDVARRSQCSRAVTPASQRYRSMRAAARNPAPSTVMTCPLLSPAIGVTSMVPLVDGGGGGGAMSSATLVRVPCTSSVAKTWTRHVSAGSAQSTSRFSP